MGRVYINLLCEVLLRSAAGGSKCRGFEKCPDYPLPYAFGPGPRPTTTLGAFLMASSGVLVLRPTKLKVGTEKVAGVPRFGTLSQGLPLLIGRL